MRTYRLLVVDDDARLRGAARLYLEARGYAVLEAGTAAEGLALAGAHVPDVIVLDLGLPDRDGLEVAEELKRRPATARIPIIIHTGQFLSGQRAGMASRLAAAVVPKGKNPQWLERDIRLVLTLARQREARRFPRYPVQLPVRWRLRAAACGAELGYAHAVARTLSEGGLMMELASPIATASLLDLRLRAHAVEFAIPGKVIWARFWAEQGAGAGAYRHGIQFMPMAPETVAALRRLLRSQAPATS